MEQTSSLTADSEWSPGSRVTVSLVSPIWSKKETPWMEPREFVRLGAVRLPLDSRLQRVAGGLGDGDGVGGATCWGRAEKDRGEAGGGGGLLSDIGCYLWRRPGGRKASQVNDIQKTRLTARVCWSAECFLPPRLSRFTFLTAEILQDGFPLTAAHLRGRNKPKNFYEVKVQDPEKFNFTEFYNTLQACCWVRLWMMSNGDKNSADLLVFTGSICWESKTACYL